jgi:cytoskeletal protein RodZ
MRAARAWLGLSLQALATEAMLGVSTVQRAENDGLEALTPANAQRLIETFSRLGVRFLDADADGPGLRIRPI